MTDAQDYSGRELDRAIAEAMGWTGIAMRPPTPIDGWEEMVGHAPDAPTVWDWQEVPEYHSSLDALADGPEKVLRERGWVSEVLSPAFLLDTDGYDPLQDLWDVRWYRAGNALQWPSRGRGATEAEARAKAVLAALNASRPVPEGGEA